jgi:hypothetical protein
VGSGWYERGGYGLFFSLFESAFHTNRIAYLSSRTVHTEFQKSRRRQLGEFILSPDGAPDRCMESKDTAVGQYTWDITKR